MDFSVLKIHGSRAFAALFALALCTGTAQANLLTATPNTLTLNCNTATGPASATVVVKAATALTGSNTISVGLGSLTGGIIVTPPGSTTLNLANNTAGLTYTLTLPAGCSGATAGAQAFHFTAGGTADVTVTPTVTITSTASALVASPNPVTITCSNSSGTDTAGPAQTVSVTSAATGGTPFSISSSGSADWLSVGSASSGSASATASTFTVAPVSGCLHSGGALAAGTYTTTLNLTSAPAPVKTVTVTLQVLPQSPLTVTPNPASLTYVKGSGTPGNVAVSITYSPSVFFSVDTTTLPVWLTVDSTSGPTPKTVHFTTTSVCDTLAPGTYTANVGLKVSGYAAKSFPISLQINNVAPKLSISGGNVQSLSWTLGTTIPTAVITAVSTDSPIPYSVVTGGTLTPIVSTAQSSGLAYSFGTPINVTFNPLIFAAAQPGNTLTGTVTLTWGSPASQIVVTINISVLSPGATLSSVSPASLPTAASGQTFSVVLTGSGFVTGTDPTQRTKVGIVAGGTLISDTNIASNVINPSNIILTVTVPAVADANLPFSTAGAGGNVVLGICNPVSGSCSTPTGTATLAIGANPIIQAVTSASAFVQVTSPAIQTVAPYDMASIFGSDFCSSGGTGCGSNQVLSGSAAAPTLTYPLSLSPDASGSTQRNLSVTFLTHGSSTVLATAPLLFATNGQINLLVPSTLATSIGSPVDIVVNFGYGSGSTMKSSAPYTVNMVATNPGIFTIGSDGQGDGAVLGSNYAVISSLNPAGIRSLNSSTNVSDTVEFYVTGLGMPDSTADNSVAGSSYAWSGDCVSTTTFLSSLNSLYSSSLATLDGTVLQSALLNSNRLVPCITTSATDVPTVTIGGVAGTVTYAGFVADSVAGLYQVNVTLPTSSSNTFTDPTGASITSLDRPYHLPVVLTANSRTSQSGVTMWVAPRLYVSPPSGAGLTGTVGVAWSSSNNAVVATGGTSPYRYALTSGLLPAGLTLSAAGVIAGSPAANTAGSYVVTVTASDSAGIPVTGTASFTLTVAGGLVISSTGSAPYSATFGTAATITTVQGSGGVYPYAYSVSVPSPLPTGVTIGLTSGALAMSNATPAGTYAFTVGGSDSTGGSPLTGSLSFNVAIALRMAHTTPTTQSSGSPGVLTTVSATGNTGSITYTLDATSLGLGYTINASTGDVGSGTATAGTRSVTITATDGAVATGATAAAVGSTTISVTIT